MKSYLYIIILLIPALHCSALSRFTISGHITDTKTGEELIGANVYLKEMMASGTTSNAYGFYSLTVHEGNYTLVAQFIGYEPVSLPINLKNNIRQDFQLSPKAREIKGIVVTGEKKNDNITNTQMGVDKMDIKAISSIPVFMGEKDILKTIQLLPGVKSAGEGNSGFYVRGGGADQNLILLDEATVYNASHLLGFFSVFNSDAIKDATLYKGGMPAEYGGRLSSVLDIKMKDGDNQKFEGCAGIGLISSRLTLEGPIVKNEGSWIVSARRTYADVFLRLSSDTTINKSILYFYDLNAKANYKLGEKDRIYLSGYFGKDVLGFSTNFSFNWGNATGTFRWNHLFNEKLFSNTSLIFSSYNYKINLGTSGNNLNILSRIQDYNIKTDFQYFLDASNKFHFGYSSQYYRILPGIITTQSTIKSVSTTLTNKYSWENDLYVSHEYKLNERINLLYGLRFTSFSLFGPGTFYSFNPQGDITDTTNASSGRIVAGYVYLEPRFEGNYVINEFSSLKASYARNTQNLHLLSNSTSGNPTDRWIPSSNNVKPEISDQVSLGYFRNFSKNTFEFSAEVYYKLLQNQIDYKNGAQLTFEENVEADLIYGSGRAYGVELFVKKKYGRFNGWIGYTLSRSERKFAGINSDSYFPAKQDRTHDVSVVGIFELNDKWTLSATWVYYTGNAVTFPSGKYQIAGQVVSYYTERNAYRMPAYHRLDLGATWMRKKTAKFESSWTFSLYNAYARDNAYTISFQQDPKDPLKTQAIQTTLFKIVPSITYNIKF